MSTLHHEMTIDAPLEKVWQVLDDLESVRFYNPLVKSVATISQNKSGVGAARHCEFKDRKYAKERVTAITPQSSISLELYEHQWPLSYMRWTTRIRPEGKGTRLVSDTEYAPGMGVFGKLLDALVMHRQFDKIIAQTLEKMKDHIESS